MKKSEIKMLQALLEQEDFKGKKLLERVIWLNTTSAKYNVGDFVKFTDLGHRIYGVPVKDFKGKVKEVMSNSKNKTYDYEIEIDVTAEDKHLTTKCFISESSISGKVRSNKNVIKPICKDSETIGISLNGGRAW